MARSTDVAILLLSIAALIASIVVYRDEVRARGPVDEAISRYELDVRRPADVDALRLQPSADLRAAYFSSMSLADVYGSVALGNLTPTERAAWIRSVTMIDEQLEDATELSLSALARRPGWAFHHAYTGELAYAALRRRALEAAANGSHRWEIPLLAGIDAAPGNLSFPAYLGGAYLETWDLAEIRGDRVEILRRGMKSARFVSRNYRAVALLLDDEQAINLLPDDTRVLKTAFRQEQKDGDVDAAATIMERIDEQERTSRASGLEEILERRRLGDIWGQRAAASQWIAAHRPEDLDDSEGRREVAQVLSLWPDTRRGAWLDDPRGRLVRYFLSGRVNDVDGETLRDGTRLLSGVPVAVEAQLAALAGDTWEAERLMRSSTTRSFEWTPGAVALTKAYLDEGRIDKAAEAIGFAPPTSMNECDVLLARREVDPENESIDETLRALLPDEIPARAFSRTGAISLCVDPRRHGGAKVAVDVESESSSLVSFGWDGGRLGSLVVDGRFTLDFDLSGIEGRHPLRVWTEAGPSVEIVRARILR